MLSLKDLYLQKLLPVSKRSNNPRSRKLLLLHVFQKFSYWLQTLDSCVRILLEFFEKTYMKVYVVGEEGQQDTHL